MNAETRIKHTQAESLIIENFKTGKDQLPGGANVAALREAAFEGFENIGLPHRRVEEWKYSDLRAFLKTGAALSEPVPAKTAEKALADAQTFGELDRFKLVIGNGRLIPELSDQAALMAEGVEVVDINALLAMEGEAVKFLLASPDIANDDRLLSLNTAFVQGGVVVNVTAGAKPSKPIEIVYLSQGSGASYARSRIQLGAEASLTVMESFVLGEEHGQTNVVSDFAVSDGAELISARLMASGDSGALLSSTIASLGANALFRSFGLIAGAPFTRNQAFVSFAGEHSRAELLGVTMGRGESLGDHTLIVDHAVPNCESKEHFKAVLDDRSKGVYQGKIIVRPHAQKTDGRMMTRTLLLSEDAEMANKPELEIFADDVQCAHGATCGEIDEELLFYLRARGIPEAEARKLLVLAFLAEVIGELEHDEIAETLYSRLTQWLDVKE